MEQTIKCGDRIYSSRWGRDCDKDAVAAVLRTSGDSSKYQPVCKVHKAVALRRGSPTSIFDLTPEIVAAIREDQAQAKARHEAKAAADAIKAQESKARWAELEAAATLTPWQFVRDDEQVPDWDAMRGGKGLPYKSIPRWIISATNSADQWRDRYEVKITEYHGQPRIELSGGSPARLTAKAAAVLFRVLTSALLEMGEEGRKLLEEADSL